MKLARSIRENRPDLPCETFTIIHTKKELREIWSDFIKFLKEKERREKAANKTNRTYDACA